MPGIIELRESVTYGSQRNAASFDVLGVRVDAVQIPDVVSRMEEWIGKRDTCRCRDGDAQLDAGATCRELQEDPRERGPCGYGWISARVAWPPKRISSAAPRLWTGVDGAFLRRNRCKRISPFLLRRGPGSCRAPFRPAGGSILRVANSGRLLSALPDTDASRRRRRGLS